MTPDTPCSGWLDMWRQRWRDYVLEGLLLGCFMVSACSFGALLFHADSPVVAMIPSAIVRRLLMGIAMGLTALALITSTIGKRTGAHMNPAVTLVFTWLGKTTPANAAGYVAGQVVGGMAGVLVASMALGSALSHSSVNYIVTIPGAAGPLGAWLTEFVLATGMIVTVLTVSGVPGWAARTPLFAATLVCLYITFAAPLSGMSLNPARTLGSAVNANVWTAVWVYFTAPVAGFFAGAAVQRVIAQRPHARACCMGGVCTSCRCLYTCHRLKFEKPGRPSCVVPNPMPVGPSEATLT